MSFSPRRPGGQLGNTNALKHGFYTRRIRKRDLSGVENTNIKGLAEEIALIRIFTRRLVESADPSADLYELAGVLRTICLASATITRIIKAQAFLVNDPMIFTVMSMRPSVKSGLRWGLTSQPLLRKVECPAAFR